ncbi:MAG: primosomal protein N' [Anaerolineales bacterium]
MAGSYVALYNSLMFVQVAVNVPSVSGVFDYHLPPELAEQVGVGFLVTVPFGSQVVQGVVLRFVEQASVAETRPVLDRVDADPVMTSAQIALAESLAEETLSPLSATVGLFLPPGLSQQADVSYSLRGGPFPQDADFGAIQKRLLNLLGERGPLRGRQIDRHFGPQDWRKAADWLVRRGLLDKRPVLPPATVRPKFVRVAQLAVPLQEAETALPNLGKTEITRKRRAAALAFLMRELDEVNVSWIYAESGCNLADLQELAGRGLIVLRENEVWRDPLEKVERQGVESSPVLRLTKHQQAAWEQIRAAFDIQASKTPFLLHGVTGSGKTELYLRAAEEAVRRGRQVIILVPEIALTPQTVRRFLARFPGQVGLIHSRLSDGERYDTWRRARAGLLKVVIGPRSALFAPLPNPGLIVLDECHDSSYYQAEPPFYHAVTAAQTYARLTGAVCILGSATPLVEQRYQAASGVMRLLELPERIEHNLRKVGAAGLPPVTLVDMREELQSGNRAIFSRALTEALAETLLRNEQAILFLNRRGTATYVFCRACGHVLKCPNCDTPLTYHASRPAPQPSSLPTPQQAGQPTIRPSDSPTTRLLCHHCGYTRQKPGKCPRCGSPQIREYGLGSEKVEAEVKALFPQARVLRWDWETTRTKDAHEIILAHFAAHRADVLVGTQMLAKGLDLPLVTLVGAVLADVGLFMPDPFAEERVFQVLTQVAGRAGRSARGGRVILQTFEPENRVLQTAAGHDYARFYADELAQRQRLGYPPFSRLVRLEFRHADNARAEAEAQKTASRLKLQIEAEGRRQTELIGPIPCFFAKLDGLYRWQVVLRGPDPVSLLRKQNLENCRVEVQPISLL